VHGISIGRQYGPTSFTGHGRTTTRRRRRVVEHHRSTPLAGQPMETVSSDRRRAHTASRHDDGSPRRRSVGASGAGRPLLR